MIVVSNASPIINLSHIGQLHLLQQLYGRVIIPTAVYREVVTAGAGQAGAAEVDQSEWMEVLQTSNRPMVIALEADLDVGEAEAITLAMELKADLLLLDERKGRAVAKQLGLRFIGILGILVEAKKQELIPAVRPLLDELRAGAGFWISEELYGRVVQAAGENSADA
jgi:hypothetical protein